MGVVRIFVYPPWKALEWSSATSLTQSFLVSVIERKLRAKDRVNGVDSFDRPFNLASDYRSVIGHAVAEINGQLADGTRYHRWTSLLRLALPALYLELAMTYKSGAASIFHDFIDGAVISGDENRCRLALQRCHQRDLGSWPVTPRFIEVAVDTYQIERIREFVHFYEGISPAPTTSAKQLRRLPANEVLHFTPDLDPYHSFLLRKSDPEAPVGGMCGSYALGILKAAGIDTRSIESDSTRFLQISGSSFEKRRFRKNRAQEPDRSDRTYAHVDPQLLWQYIEKQRLRLIAVRSDQGSIHPATPEADTATDLCLADSISVATLLGAQFSERTESLASPALNHILQSLDPTMPIHGIRLAS